MKIENRRRVTKYVLRIIFISPLAAAYYFLDLDGFWALGLLVVFEFLIQGIEKLIYGSKHPFA